MIKAYLFDLDDTITLTQKYHYLALHKVFSEYGVDYTQEEDKQKHSGKGSQYTCRVVLTEAGKKPDTAEIERCANRKKLFYNDILAHSHIQEVAGIQAFLEKAKKAGIRIIIATGNRPEPTDTILTRTGLKPFFDEIVSHDDVKNAKPAPDIFLLAAQKAGAKPEECLVFEDSINGVMAAHAAGMYCVGLATGTPGDQLIAAGAGIAVPDYKDEKLYQYLQKINQ